MIMDEKSTLFRTLGLNLVQAARDWRRLAARTISGDNVSEACAVALLWAARLGGGVRQVILADHVGIEGASLVRILDQLCAAGLVTRRPDPTDRRANCVWLTEAGLSAANTLEEKLNAMRANVLNDLDEADVHAALRVFDAIEAATGRPRRREFKRSA
jgi:MarR family transcriptional regulator, transcriptional regulator for hemolysin